MKKIMFNDDFCQTQSVLKGIKTRKSSLVLEKSPYKNAEIEIRRELENSLVFAFWKNADKPSEHLCLFRSLFGIGELVAISQNYNVIGKEMEQEPDNPIYSNYARYAMGKNFRANANKMFVRCDIMPHHIRITDVKIQLLHEITDEECMQEGVIKFENECHDVRYSLFYCPWEEMKETPKEAFRAMIDSEYGKSLWDKNPYMKVYEFELID